MIDARFRPLLKWNREPALKFRQSQFKTAYNKTLDALEHEMRHLKARNIVIEAGYRLDQIRNDGWPRGGTSPSHPGVVLYFESADGALCFPCGTYFRLEHNMHAIALTLENLRAVDRYGVTLAHQQYIGFAALPEPQTKGTLEEAALVLASLSAVPKDYLIDSAEAYRDAYRRVAAKLHPDKGGDPTAWHEFQNAAILLQKHHSGGLV